jgi:hypothetical protein
MSYLRQHAVALLVLAFLLLGAIVSVYVSSIQRDKAVLQTRLDRVLGENNWLRRQWEMMPTGKLDSLKTWVDFGISAQGRRLAEHERRLDKLDKEE